MWRSYGGTAGARAREVWVEWEVVVGTVIEVG